MFFKKYASTSQLIMHIAHSLLQPVQNALRKGRLKKFDISPGASLPVVQFDLRLGRHCGDPHCQFLIGDALEFHRPNAPREGLRRWIGPSAMLLDLNQFKTGDDYVRAVSKRSRGNIPRAAKKAARLGVTCKQIRPESYAASIEAINASKRFRSGGPVLAAWLGPRRGLTDSRASFEAPACPKHWTIFWGAFIHEGGEPRLIAYLSLRRVGDMCRTHELMAHGDYLNTGAMKLLFLEVGRWLADRQARESQGLSWFMYGALEHGGRGLDEWKRLFCFEPKNFTMTASTSDFVAKS